MQLIESEEKKLPNLEFNSMIEMSSNDFGGERTYVADFEIYDQRAVDPANTSLDIYIGIK